MLLQAGQIFLKEFLVYEIFGNKFLLESLWLKICWLTFSFWKQDFFSTIFLERKFLSCLFDRSVDRSACLLGDRSVGWGRNLPPIPLSLSPSPYHPITHPTYLPYPTSLTCHFLSNFLSPRVNFTKNHSEVRNSSFSCF